MFGNLIGISALVFVAALLWLVISVLRMLFPRWRKSAKRQAIISLVLVPLSVIVLFVASDNHYRDYGLDGPEGLEAAQAAADEQAAIDRAERDAAAAIEAEERAVREIAERAEQHCADGVMAAIMSEHFISQQLRAPSTANYPSASAAQISQIGECTMRVHSYVDAQNAFGAMLRSRYQIDMEYLPETDRWRGSNAIIE